MKLQRTEFYFTCTCGIEYEIHASLDDGNFDPDQCPACGARPHGYQVWNQAHAQHSADLDDAVDRRREQQALDLQ